MKQLFSKLNRLIYFVVLASLTFLTLLFQNCGSPFQSNYKTVGSESIDMLSSVSKMVSPESITGIVGESAVLSVYVPKAIGYHYNFQWRRNGADLPGQIYSDLILSNLKMEDAGAYYVTAQLFDEAKDQNVGQAEIRGISLNVKNVPGSSAPTISLDTKGLTAKESDFTYLHATVDGYPKPTIQWYFNNALLVGENREYLIFNGIRPTQAGVYKAIASNNAGSMESSPGLVLVNQESAAPALQSITEEQRIAKGSNLSLNAVVTGFPAPTFQWYKDEVLISSATQSSYKLSNPSGANSGLYKLVSKNSAGSISSIVKVTVIDSITFTQGLGNKTVGENSDVDLKVVTAGEVDKYEWFLDGELIPDANTSALKLTAVKVPPVGQSNWLYKVRATNSFGSAESSMYLTVLAGPVIKPLAATFIPYDGVAQIYVTVVSGSGLTFQWFKDGTAIPGSTGSSISVSSLTPNVIGLYKVQVTNAGGMTETTSQVSQCAPNMEIKSTTDFNNYFRASSMACNGSLFSLKSDLDFNNVPRSAVYIYNTILDGENHTIKNVKIVDNFDGVNNRLGGTGLFSTGSKMIFMNLKLDHFDITGGLENYTGALVGNAFNSTFYNISLNNSTIGQLSGTGHPYVGALIGAPCNMTIAYVSVENTTVPSNAQNGYFGGIAGFCGNGGVYGIISNSYSTAYRVSLANPNEAIPIIYPRTDFISDKSYGADNIQNNSINTTGFDFTNIWNMGIPPTLRHTQLTDSSPQLFRVNVDVPQDLRLNKNICYSLNARVIDFKSRLVNVPTELKVKVSAPQINIYASSADCEANKLASDLTIPAESSSVNFYLKLNATAYLYGGQQFMAYAAGENYLSSGFMFQVINNYIQ